MPIEVTTKGTTARIDPKGPYSLAASRAFLHGFTPSQGTADTGGDALVLAFRLERAWDPVAVALVQTPDAVTLEIAGTRDVASAARQAARILSLDHDATGWAALGARDPVIGRLQAEKPGFRPVCFASAYEAGLWGILAQRMPMARAAAVKRELAVKHGDTVEVAGRAMHVVPAPERLAAIESIPGLPAVKVERLRAFARAAADGALDTERLRALPEDEALEDLQRLPGVGAWTAQHILMRGTGPTDALPTAEPRLLEAVQRFWGLERATTPAALARLAEGWRPWRMWVTVLVVAAGWAESSAPRGRGVRR